jgi:diguanylate cyclase (GGDEF)-like protein
VRKRWVLLATAGLFLALAVGIGLLVLAGDPIQPRRWLIAAAATLVVQGVVFVLAHLGRDALLVLDRHFVVTPMLGATLLLSLFVYLVPELRHLIVMVWLVTPLFAAGFAGLAQLVALAMIMAGGYLLAVGLRIAEGLPLTFGRELQVAAALVIMGVFIGVVLERLKRNRLETKRLRRELAELAHTDALTGLPNRRHFEESLRAELARVTRYGGTCALAVLDVDHFKGFNDRRGHPAGDQALQELAALMRRDLRTPDLAARIGGEEFGVIMAGTGAAAGAAVVERLRSSVVAHRFGGGEPGELTISAGVASCPGDAATYEKLLALADDALYRAKGLGRNRVCLADPAAEPNGASGVVAEDRPRGKPG